MAAPVPHPYRTGAFACVLHSYLAQLPSPLSFSLPHLPPPATQTCTPYCTHHTHPATYTNQPAPRRPTPQVVHCRRILKWTYATAFYTFEEPAGASKEAKERMAQHQEFFEFNQVGGRVW